MLIGRCALPVDDDERDAPRGRTNEALAAIGEDELTVEIADRWKQLLERRAARLR
jgi:hypothetical protein